MASFMIGLIFGNALFGHSNSDARKYDASLSLGMRDFFKCIENKQCTNASSNSYNEKITPECDKCLKNFVKYLFNEYDYSKRRDIDFSVYKDEDCETHVENRRSLFSTDIMSEKNKLCLFFSPEIHDSQMSLGTRMFFGCIEDKQCINVSNNINKITPECNKCLKQFVSFLHSETDYTSRINNHFSVYKN